MKSTSKNKEIKADGAYDTLFAKLGLLEERLSDKRFLMGDFITEADVRLCVTLV